MDEAAPRSSLGTRLRQLLHRLDAFLDARSERLSRTHVHAQLEHALGALHTSGQIGEHPSNRPAGDGYGAMESTTPSAPPGEAASVSISLPSPRRRLSTAALAATATHPATYRWRLPVPPDDYAPLQWLWLALIGYATSLICFLTIECGEQLYALQQAVTLASAVGGVAFRTLLALSAFAVCVELSEDAAGSGIPEIKCVLHGMHILNLLSGRTLIAKAVGLVLAYASGLSIGHLGPFCHMAVCAAALLVKSGLFPALSLSRRRCLMAYSAAVAAGMGATFGAPFGGVMFSLELMARTYQVHYLSAALWTALNGYGVLRALSPWNFSSYFDVVTVGTGDATGAPLGIRELLAHAILVSALGVTCGLLGALFNQAVGALVHWRVRRCQHTRSRFWLVLTVALGGSVGAIALGGMADTRQRDGVSQMFTPGATVLWTRWSTGAAGLFPFVLFKAVATAFAIILPLPCGVFLPVFELGAALGHACRWLLPPWPPFSATDLSAASVAMIGSAAFASGVTQTVSASLVVLELTGNRRQLWQLGMASVVAFAVTRHLTDSLFVHLLRLRGVTLFQQWEVSAATMTAAHESDVAGRTSRTPLTVADVMDTRVPIVTPDSTVRQVLQLLQQMDERLPVVYWCSAGWPPRLYGAMAVSLLWAYLERLLGADEHDGRQQQRWQVRLDDPLPLLRDRGGARAHVDVAPPTIPANAPLRKLDAFFSVLGAAHVLVLAPTALGDADDADAGNVPVGIVYKEALLV